MHGYTVFTHNLDFGTVLALTHATGPSVFHIRAQDILGGLWNEWLLRP